VRCLPNDFLTWTTSLTGPTEAEWYLTTPGVLGVNYPAIFDRNGVPVWWGEKALTLLVDLLDNDEVLQSIINGDLEHRRLDNTLVRSISVAAPDVIDFHDGLLLPNGNYVIVVNVTKSGFDFSSWNPPGPADGKLLDHEIREVTRDGQLVWSWSAAEHIGLEETGPTWQATLTEQANGYDAFHWNSIEDTGDGFVISMRHNDAVYKISRATKEIVWKLGGSHTDQSLTFVDDPAFPTGTGPFGGQHDARVLPDGTVTLHDNGTTQNRAPRAVRYAIDETARTATLLEAVTSTQAPVSECCGSARRLPGGHWVIGWGNNTTSLATEEDGAGNAVFSLRFPDGNVMYRIMPVLPGQLTRETLIAAMDARYP
jgi:hypothetical protein